MADRAGFVVNALLFPYLNNAVRMLENGTASMEDIDTAMQGGCNFPMGPFALLDLVGLDTSVSILDALYEEFRDRTTPPCRCCGGWWPPAGWAARPVKASTRTPADGGSGRSPLVDLDGAEAWDRRPLEPPPTRWGSRTRTLRRRGPGGHRWRPRAGDDPAGLSPGAVPHARRPTPPRLVVTGRARRHPARHGVPPSRSLRRSCRRYGVSRPGLPSSSPTAPGPTAPTDGSRRRSSRPTPGCTSSAGPTASRPGPTRVSWPEGCTGFASAASSQVSPWCTSTGRVEGRPGGADRPAPRERRLLLDVQWLTPTWARWGRSPPGGVPRPLGGRPRWHRRKADGVTSMSSHPMAPGRSVKPRGDLLPSGG